MKRLEQGVRTHSSKRWIAMELQAERIPTGKCLGNQARRFFRLAEGGRNARGLVLRRTVCESMEIAGKRILQRVGSIAISHPRQGHAERPAIACHSGIQKWGSARPVIGLHQALAKPDRFRPS